MKKLITLIALLSCTLAFAQVEHTVKQSDIVNGTVTLTIKLNIESDVIPVETPPVTQPIEPIDQVSAPIINWTNKVFYPALFSEDISEVMPLSTVDNPHIPKGLSTQFNIEYAGAMRPIADGESSSNYATGTLAINPARNSILMAGHNTANAVAEWLLPNELSKTDIVTDIIEPEVLQHYTKMLNGVVTNKITGMLVVDDYLLLNSEVWYDANGKNKDNLKAFKALNLSESATGILQLEGAAKAAGYMSKVPRDTQRKVGGKYITGWASSYSITSRLSQGPSMYLFDPQNAIDGHAMVNTTPLLVYPFSGKEGNTELVQGSSFYTDTAEKLNPMWSALANGMYGFIVPHTRLFLVVGSQGGLHQGAGYKITQTNGNVCGGGCTVNPDDVYNYFWLYDIDEILSAEQPWDARPVSYGKWIMPFSGKLTGATFDDRTDRLYMTINKAGRTGGYGANPLIIAYTLRAKQ